jgi:hypothetical protein
MHILLWARPLPEHQSPEWGFLLSWVRNAPFAQDRSISLIANVSEVVFVILRRKCGDSGNLPAYVKNRVNFPFGAIGGTSLDEFGAEYKAVWSAHL